MRTIGVLSVAVVLVPLPASAADDASAVPADPVMTGAPPESTETNHTVNVPSFETVVVAPKTLSKDATQDATEVGGEEIRDSPRGSMFEALSQAAADVYVPAHGAMHGVANGATGGVHIRGLGGSPNSQVLVVEDGVPDYQGIFGHPIPDAYMPSLIDTVLIVKGGDSVLYGTNAMGGVIVIRSRWLKRDGLELSTDTAYGSYATSRESVAALARFGAWDVTAGVFAMSSNGHRDGAGGDELVGRAAVRYRLLPDLRLTISNKVVHLNGADAGPASHPFTDHWYDVLRDNAAAELRWSGDATRLTVTPYLNVGIHRLYDGFYSRDYVGGGNAELTFGPHPAVEAILGLHGERVDGDVRNRITSQRPGVRPHTEVALYNQVTWRPVAPLTLLVGTRELYDTRYGTLLLYKAGGRWEVYDGVSVHTRVAHNYRQPTLRELYLPYPTANPELKPESSLNWDFGISYSVGHLEASCSGYRSQARDLIKYFGAWPAAEVVNIDRVVVWGVEGQVGVKRVGPASLFVTGNWQSVGRFTRQNPEAKVDVTLDLEQEFGVHVIGGSISGEWVHGLYMADYSRRPIPDVAFMDLTLRYRYAVPDRGLTLDPYLLLRNFLDRRYAYVQDYPMPGFNVLAGLKIGI